MLRITLPGKHYTTPRNSRYIHRIVPGFNLFPRLFRQVFLG